MNFHHSGDVDDDDDGNEASIYDLDHAPPPPPISAAATWTGRSEVDVTPPPMPRPAAKPARLSSKSLRDGMLTSGSPQHTKVHETVPSPFSSFWLNKTLPSPSATHSHKGDGATGISPRKRSQSHSSLFSSTPTTLLHEETSAVANSRSLNSKMSSTRSFPPSHQHPRDHDLSPLDDHTTNNLANATGFMDDVEQLPQVDELDVSNASGENAATGESGRSPAHSGSAASDGQHVSGGEDWEDDDADSESIATSSPQRVVFFGLQLPMWCSKRRISWNRVATFVVEKAPCFLCIRMKQGTYRSVLVRLNILCACCASVQLALSLWFYIIMQNSSIVDRNLLVETQSELERQSNFEVVTNVWNLNVPVWCLGACASVVLVAIGLTVRVVQNVNLVGTIRFLWLILWVIPLQVFWTIGLFDYFQVTPVWIKFWWRDRTMTWFRNRFCDPDTANSLCAVPVFVSIEDSTSWCLINYGADNCTDIRDSAQGQMERFMYRFYYVYAAWTIAFLLLLFLAVKTLESIVSQPLVQKSRESNVPVWLSLPIIGCIVSGALYSFSSTSVLSTRVDARSQTSWIGPLFILAGGMFLLAALLAVLLGSFRILNTRHKRHKSIAIMGFIVLSILIVLVLTTVFSACIAFSLSYEKLPISDKIRGEIACFIDQSGSCSDCNSTEGSLCPEWSNDDVTRIIQSQAKAGASLAAIFLMYAFGALRYGLALRTHMSNYMIDYV